MILDSYCEKDTLDLAKMIAAEAKKGDIICLDGDLGCGKTVFAKGFAEALGVKEPVTSPTFTLVKEYHDGRLPMYHFDVYRISDPDEMNAIGYEEYFFSDGVSLVEWSDLIRDLIPGSAIRIRILKDPAKGDDYRRIEID